MASKKAPSAAPPLAPGAQSGSKKAQVSISRPPQTERIKIISMGSGGAGKSCLIKRYCEDRFVSKYIATIGVDYGVKPVRINCSNNSANGSNSNMNNNNNGNSNSVEVRVNFWDLSGHPEFFEIRNEFYKDAQGALLVFDVNARESFDECDAWLAECAKFGGNPREMPIALCANKVDGKRRLVSEEEGRAYAQSRGLSYFETSAASGQNVMEMFDSLFQAVFMRVKGS